MITAGLGDALEMPWVILERRLEPINYSFHAGSFSMEYCRSSAEILGPRIHLKQSVDCSEAVTLKLAV